jgi:hypothetical protein
VWRRVNLRIELRVCYVAAQTGTGEKREECPAAGAGRGQRWPQSSTSASSIRDTRASRFTF